MVMLLSVCLCVTDKSLTSSPPLTQPRASRVQTHRFHDFQLPTNKDAFRKTWNPKYTLRSHFDGVRALAFHPVEPVLVTVSEDHTLKLWNLQKTVPAKKQVLTEHVYIYIYINEK